MHWTQRMKYIFEHISFMSIINTNKQLSDFRNTFLRTIVEMSNCEQFSTVKWFGLPVNMQSYHNAIQVFIVKLSTEAYKQSQINVHIIFGHYIIARHHKWFISRSIGGYAVRIATVIKLLIAWNNHPNRCAAAAMRCDGEKTHRSDINNIIKPSSRVTCCHSGE